jgi:agmatine/peptidylarginine deiminase
MSTPKEDNFRMPAEFEPHTLTWMAFPHKVDNWRNNAKDAQKAICNLANLVSKFEKVIMIVPRRCMRAALSSVDDTVSVVVGETDDAWVRDSHVCKCIKQGRQSDDIFEISDEFYEKYKDSDTCIDKPDICGN